MRVPVLSVALLAAITWTGTAAAAATELQATVREVSENGTGAEIGTVTVTESSGGAIFAADLHDLPPGEHGFHVHEKGDCGPGPNDQGLVVAGGAAGGHRDPEGTKQHLGPEGHGHLGDLPVLTVGADGTAKEELTAPRIKDLGAVRGHALVIHASGDNYADAPRPLGGGGARIACGVIRWTPALDALLWRKRAMKRERELDDVRRGYDRAVLDEAIARAERRLELWR